MEAERFDVESYLRCDCASVENQTCDKCAVRGHIASLTRELKEAKVAVERAYARGKEAAAQLADAAEDRWCVEWRTGLKADARLEAFSDAAGEIAKMIRDTQIVRPDDGLSRAVSSTETERSE